MLSTKKIIPKTQVSITQVLIIYTNKFKSYYNVTENVNMPVPSHSYLHPSFFYLNVLINLIVISRCFGFVMLLPNLLTYTLPFIVYVVKVLLIPSSFKIISDFSSVLKPFSCIWVNFNRSFQPCYVVSERQREMNRKRQQ
jgi:hypothetical protein